MTKKEKIQKLKPHADIIKETVMADITEMEKEIAKKYNYKHYCLLKGR